MIRYQSGSLEAFQEIYTQLAPGVRRYLSHLAGGSEIIDDLLQETFLQMHRSRAAYNPNMRLDLGCSVWRETFF